MENFFAVYLAAPIVIIQYVVWKILKRTKIKRAHEIDVTSGRREMDLATILAEERAVLAGWPMWKKVYDTVC